jgi:hypothetical protein
VPIRTLDAILCEAGIGGIDLLSIDVEGTELDVLAGFTIERYRPRLILLEDDTRTRDKHGYMTARGYKLVRRTDLNNWYVPRDTAFPVSLFGRWQLLRKMYLGAPLRRWRERWRQDSSSPGRGAVRHLPAAGQAPRDQRPDSAAARSPATVTGGEHTGPRQT